MSELDPIPVDLDYSTEPYTSELDPRPLIVVSGRLYDYLTGLEARVTALEQFSGSGAYTTKEGSWQINPQAGTAPGGRQVTASDANWTQATWLRFDPFSQDGTDMTPFLNNADQIFGQMKRDGSNWIIYNVTGDTIVENGYIQVPVEFSSNAGGIDSAQWQDAVVVLHIPTPTP